MGSSSKACIRRPSLLLDIFVFVIFFVSEQIIYLHARHICSEGSKHHPDKITTVMCSVHPCHTQLKQRLNQYVSFPLALSLCACHAPNICIQPYIIIYKLRLLNLHHHYTCMQFMKATKVYIFIILMVTQKS
jgi:hypothetical protein